jgi:lipopolysaccharide transport system ATP-binding protein
MSELAIRVEGLSKQFRIAANHEKYRTLRDSLTNAFTAPLRKLRSVARRGAEDSGKASKGNQTFWALRDVSFKVPPGEAVGIIGRNGAGKSTLLKVLSRITEPTTGYADIRGRVRSLLEVGTGFHQELSGRENIFLNGAILGMKRAEIERKFDEIVAFAEVEKFIDTPVKRYSSGMYLRLAFAVAAHLESEILFVDEVLAVGDAAFQRKCLGKMNEVAQEGRTVLFVSHNMSAVKELCQSGILLDAGQVAFQGTSSQCIAEYLKRLENSVVKLETGSAPFAIGQLRTESKAGQAIVSGEPFKVMLPLAGKHIKNAWMFFIVEDFTGNTVIHSRVGSRDIGIEDLDGECQLELEIPGLWLTPGVYTAYFKFLIPSIGASSGRYYSERAMLQVDGQIGHEGKAVLSPRIEWKPTKLEMAQKSAAK